MTQIRVPADVAKTDQSNVWGGTQDFTAATVLGASGPGGGAVSGATATTAGVLQLAGDLAGSYTAPTVAKLNGATPAAVATSGAYSDLTGRPALATVATSGAYPDLTGRPALATVATSGAYPDLTGRPALATVATSGAYPDLTGRPALAAVATSGAYSDLSGAPAAPLTAVKTADTNCAATLTADPHLTFANVAVGTYLIEVEVASSITSAGAPFQYRITGTAALGSLPTGGPASGKGRRLEQPLVGSGTTANAQWLSWDPLTLTQPTAGAGSLQTSLSPIQSKLTAVLTVTAAGSVAFGHQTGGSAAAVYAGGWMRLTKVA